MQLCEYCELRPIACEGKVEKEKRQMRSDNYSCLSSCEAAEEVPVAVLVFEGISDPETFSELEASAGSEESAS